MGKALNCLYLSEDVGRRFIFDYVQLLLDCCSVEIYLSLEVNIVD